ncbi:phosphoadenylyl-sulfate reductase [Arhodomonas sp. AD133]|uniref:phosphoadenylyl-sulfate reductase n=1 Tax=Arhodomonas sp. AD133 TaxID=3415009 RepID=UPI003EBC297E
MNPRGQDALRSAETKAEWILQRFEAYSAEDKRLFATSSFQTQSLPLLHILSRSRIAVPVVFLNTGYLFPETLRFRDQLVQRLGLQLVDLRPNLPKSEQRTPDGKLLFAANPDKCCHINKVEPLDPYLSAYDVWISGVRADQSSTRAGFEFEQQGPHETVRFHPMLDWNAREVHAYRVAHELPAHPLESQGYLSIGCMPCTMPYTATLNERGGRWSGQSKTECGLHTELASTQENQA